MKKNFLTLCVLLAFAMSANAVKVVFRLDDATMQYDSVNNRILQMFVEKQIPLSVAMVACSADEIPYEINDSAYWQLLNNPNIEIALHGLTHQNINNNGEFGSLTSEETQRRFMKGKHTLNQHLNKTINTFVPPFNAINASFPENLEAAEFHILSSDMYRDTPCKSNIQHYPETLGHLMSQKGIWNAAKESILTCKINNAVCVIMFHAYDLPDAAAWQQLDNLLDYCIESDEVELYTFSSLLASGNRSDWLRYKSNQLSSGLSKLLLPKGVLYPTWICLLTHFVNALIYMLIAIIGIIILLKRTRSTRTKTIFRILLVAIGIIIFCAAWFHLLSPLKLLLLSVSINALPLAGYYLQNKHSC